MTSAPAAGETLARFGQPLDAWARGFSDEDRQALRALVVRAMDRRRRKPGHQATCCGLRDLIEHGRSREPASVPVPS